MSSMSTGLRTAKSLSKEMTSSNTETNYFESGTSCESNLPIATIVVVPQDIHTETSSDSETDQHEQGFIESLSENEDLQEHQPQCTINNTTSYHKAPSIGLKKIMTVPFKTYYTEWNHNTI